MNSRIPGGGPQPIDPGFGPHGRFVAVPWWIHLVELLIVVAVILAVVLIILAIVRSPRVLGTPGTMIAPALAELDLRYARGEIDREDYLQRRADLTGQPLAKPLPTESPPPEEAKT
jgi:putative membrane protein